MVSNSRESFKEAVRAQGEIIAALQGTADLAALIGEIYDAATDRSRWAGLMERLTPVLCGTSARVFSPGPPQSGIDIEATYGIDPTFLSLYGRHYHQHDVVISSAAESDLLHAGWTGSWEEIIDRKLLERSTYYNEFLKPCGTGGAISMVLLDNEKLPGAPPTILSVFRPPESPLFDAKTVELAKLLAPHLQRALLIYWRLAFAEARAQAGEAVLDRLDHGVIQLSAEARVLYANDAASEALGAGRALCLEHGMLATRAPGYASRLRSLLQQARNGVGGLLHIPAPDGRPGMLIVATPLPLESGTKWHPQTRVLVLLSSAQDRASTRVGLLARCYGLTRAETRVLELLATDHSPAEIAESLGTRVHTVRSQLKSIYLKTGVHGQREMLALLARLPDIKTEQAPG